MIYCIGNSHANFFAGEHPGTTGRWTTGKEQIFSSHSIGPVIAYNFLNNHLSKVYSAISSIHNFDADKDYIMLVVGEVDCRLHLPKIIQEKKIHMETLVEECVKRFFESVLVLKNKGYNMITWGGHPSTLDPPDNNWIFEDCSYRNKISVHFSNYLEKLSIENNIPFMSLVNDLIDENGLTKMQYFIDYCHLNTDMLIDVVCEKTKKLNLKE